LAFATRENKADDFLKELRTAATRPAPIRAALGLACTCNCCATTTRSSFEGQGAGGAGRPGGGVDLPHSLANRTLGNNATPGAGPTAPT